MTARRRARLDVLGRLGLVARALVYSMIGVLAAQAALGLGHPKLDRRGAMEVIAQQPLGPFILFGLAFGFIAFALWRWGLAAFPPRPLPWWKRAGYVASGIFHAGVAVLALLYLAGTHGEDQWDEADLTAMVLALPLGPWVLAAIGAGLLGDAGWAAYAAISLRFRRRIERHELSERADALATWTGVAGLAVRGIVHGLMGTFLLRAAWLEDPTEALGFDGALWFLHRVPWGGFIVALLAAGLLARGAWDAIEARYRPKAR